MWRMICCYFEGSTKSTIQIGEVWPCRVRGRVGSVGLVMGHCVVRIVLLLVYAKYFVITITVIRGQCCNTQLPITNSTDPTPLTLPGQTSYICIVLYGTKQLIKRPMASATKQGRPGPLSADWRPSK